ncbi:glycosyl transferase family, a/b domain-containing protein [Fimicolochytrium jonesii]|uniref:glycosyl transferase family, a/b domain-containing protein n=1 Tax=Fimicolochytrium jonesii TaxID=1396493 RepID=UPI0022FE0279|nr:glycosyl transferase family, a/b domain-containing protein [Fimicolochytrium jonesii]KAI8826839.1 glycosyl transferase family, a/b domain-containing protein [Fimicolochytrium jonesii]
MTTDTTNTTTTTTATTDTTSHRHPFAHYITLLLSPTAATTFTAPLARSASLEIMAGRATNAQIGAFLVLLKQTGLETDPAIVAAVASAMREAALGVEKGCVNGDTGDIGEWVDIVGTGGDGMDTFNVSTAAGIVAAGAGCSVAKHGNRASSSKCGSADVLEALDCHLTSVTPASVPTLVNKPNGGFCFLFSQKFHPAMKYVAAARKELGVRTIFNLLGPLSSPARPTRVVVGVHTPSLGPMMAESLRLSGVTRAWVVCGAMGLDEISPEGATHVWSLTESGAVEEGIVTPADFGLEGGPLRDVVGGGKRENARLMREVLRDPTAISSSETPTTSEHTRKAITDFILLNVAALLYVAGKAPSLVAAVELARESINSGKAWEALVAFRDETRRLREVEGREGGDVGFV